MVHRTPRGLYALGAPYSQTGSRLDSPGAAITSSETRGEARPHTWHMPPTLRCQDPRLPAAATIHRPVSAPSCGAPQTRGANPESFCAAWEAVAPGRERCGSQALPADSERRLQAAGAGHTPGPPTPAPASSSPRRSPDSRGAGRDPGTSWGGRALQGG
ncbi:hypothetical protein NDU88_006723 [Pleurodeles waltl]|uniref:Uncharacterized protein n=1 Tax=Pleurodeles waltl TaxID=8319 RepID=A0AAV7VRH4_PLEWA|nr:hypothetical protein NDU88_006723 [Pleurodeles waltl]